jgi:hypothetical protein
MRGRDLIPDQPYFVVSIVPARSFVPGIATLFFVRHQQQLEDGSDLWIFRQPTGVGKDALVQIQDRELSSVYDLHGLNAWLADHAKFQPVASEEARRGAIPELGPALDRVFGTGEMLTLLIRHTSKGFSLRPNPDGVRWNLTVQRERRDREEARIREVFASTGIAPRGDRALMGGRFLQLGYELPRDRVQTEFLCVRVLREVHEMRERDELIFTFRGKLPAKSD